MDWDTIFYLIESKAPFNNQISIYTSKQNVVQLSTSSEKFFHKLCLASYSTLKGRLDALKEIYRLKKNIPIYINEHLIFMPLKIDNQKYYLNYQEISDITTTSDEQVLITFSDLSTLSLMINKRLIYNRLRVVQDIVKGINRKK